MEMTGKYLGTIRSMLFLHHHHFLVLGVFVVGVGKHNDTGTGGYIRVYSYRKGDDTEEETCRFVDELDDVLLGSRPVLGLCDPPTSAPWGPMTENDLASVYFMAWGGRTCALLHLSLDGSEPLRVVWRLPSWSDWIQTIQLLPAEKKEHEGLCWVMGSAHGVVEEWAGWKEPHCVRQVQCEESCLVRSMDFRNDGWVASGTVFGDIFLWNMGTGEKENVRKVHCRLQGHEGGVFDVHWGNKEWLVSASEDRTVRCWKIPLSLPETLIPQWTCFGHASRVWKCAFALEQGAFLSGGEDSLCCVWNMEDGSEIGRGSGHIGGGISALQVIQRKEEWTVVTAGFDSTVKFWKMDGLLRSRSFADRVVKEKESMYSSSMDFPLPPVLQHAGCRNMWLHPEASNVLVVVHSGAVLRLDVASAAWCTVTEPQAWTVTCCAASEDRSLVALGGSQGEICVVGSQGQFPTYQWESHDGGRLAWLQCVRPQKNHNGVCTCWEEDGPMLLFSATWDGRVHIWSFEEGVDTPPRLRAAMQLPDKDPPNTVTVAWEVGCLVFGGRTGDIDVFEIPLLEEDHPDMKRVATGGGGHSPASLPIVTPLSHMRRVHHGRPINHLYIEADAVNGFALLTVGSDGNMCRHIWSYKDACVHKAGHDGSHAAPSAPWLTVSAVHAIQGMNSPSRIMFVMDRMHVVGFKFTALLIWDAVSFQQVMHVECGGMRRPWDVAHTRDMEMVAAFWRHESVCIRRLSTAVVPRGLTVGTAYHGRQVMGATWLPLKSGGLPVGVLATGSEDTLIKLVRLNGAHGLVPTSTIVEQKCTVFAMEWMIPLNGDRFNPLLITSGARGLLRTWKLSIPPFGESTALYYRSMFSWKPNKSSQSDAAPRAMTMLTTKIDGVPLLVVGLSDGMLRIFRVEEKTGSLSHICHSLHAWPQEGAFDRRRRCCVLSVADAVVHGKHLLFSGGTDGRILAWDLHSVHVMEDTCTELKAVRMDWAPHQCGANSLAIVGYDPWKLVSVGDDQSLAVWIGDIQENKLITRRQTVLQGAAGAGLVKVIATKEDEMITIASDQRLSRWKVIVEKEDVHVMRVGVQRVSLADPTSMVLLEDVDGLGNHVAIVGGGCEVVKIP